MAISFSGLASGMDTSSWVEALVSVKQQEITKLESNKATVAAAQQTLNSIKSYFNSFQSILENITDARFGIASIDLFSQNLAESSNVSVLSAIASTSAENTTYNIEVNKLATATEVNSGIKTTFTKEETPTASMDSKLFSLIAKDENNNPITMQAGDIEFYVDGHVRSISIDENSTISSFLDDLNGIGIAASYNESSGIFSINIDTRDDATGTTKLKNDATNVMKALNLQDVNRGYKTNTIKIHTTDINTDLILSSKLEDLGITNANDLKYSIIQNNGTTISSSFTQETTLEQMFSKLENDYGITSVLNDDGTIVMTSGTFGNVFGGALAEAFGFTTTEDPHVSLTKMTSTAIVYSTEDTVVNRDSTLAQIGAVAPNSSGALVIRNCDGGDQVTTINLSANSTVQDLFNAMAAHGITATIDDGVITLNSTAGKYVDGSIATNLGILHPVVDTYYTTAPVTMTSSSTIDTSKSLGALGMSSDGSVVIYSPVYGVVSVNIAKELTVSQFCQRINDSNYGIKAEISGNKVKISELEGSGAYVKGMSTVLQTALKLNVGEDQSYHTTATNIYSNTDSKFLKYGDSNVEINGDTQISKINGYNHGNGSILLHQNGTVTTITVDKTLTLEEFINNPIVGLAQYGITGQVLSDGKAYLTADSDIYLEQVSGGSNILSALKLSSVQKTYSGDHVRTTGGLNATVITTATEVAKGSDKLNSTVLVNGTVQTIDATGTMVFTVNGYYKTIALDENDTYNSLIEKLGKVGINAYLTTGSFYIASGYDDVQYKATESSSNAKFASLLGLTGPQDLGGYSTSSQPVLSKVVTSEDKVLSASNYADMSTKLSTLSISSGKLTVYKNGQKREIEVNENNTFGELQAKLADANTGFSDLRLSFEDGYMKIYSTDSSAKISLGSTSDKTNFIAITGLTAGEDNSIVSSRQLYKINDKTSLDEVGLFRSLGSNEKITEGSFKVGDADIYITKGENGKITTTISDIVAQINASEKSLATAYWDNIDGQLVIKSTLTGASAINIEAGTTNFTDVLGLTNGGNLVMDNQKIGSNATVTINGVKYTSLSNTVTSESTGLTGLTLNLKGLTSGSAVQLTVKRDTESLINAIHNVLDGYNELISNIDTAIAKEGNLKDQSMLRLIRNNIRTAMNSSDLGTTRFRNLSAIGIKASGSNASNISTKNADIIDLSLDEETFLNAFENYEDDVKALLIGSVDENGNVINKGVLVKVEELIENALTAAGGYFTTANNAYNSQLESISDKIVNGTAAIEKYRKRLEHKFSSMDIMIAGMQNQFASFLS